MNAVRKGNGMLIGDPSSFQFSSVEVELSGVESGKMNTVKENNVITVNEG